MTVEQQILLALLALPLIGAVVVWVLGPERGDLVRGVSTVVSLVLLVLASYLAWQFYHASDHRIPEAKRGELVPTFRPIFVPGSTAADPSHTTWDVLPIGSQGAAVQFYLGVDGLNIWLILLTAVLLPSCVLVSFKYIGERVNEYYAWLLALQTPMLGVFLAFDLVLFYSFFELTLVPLFFLIGIWGGAQRQYAARKFVIYTLTASLFTLLGVIGVVIMVASQGQGITFAIPDLITRMQALASNPATAATWQNVQFWIFFALFAGFAVKVPLMPFHTWLPLAHVEAPTAGSVDLAGVLLKLGTYGFLRLCIPLAPDAAFQYGLPLITWVAAAGIVYGAFCAYAQHDIKKLIAYSSVSHLGLCMLGMFSLTTAGLAGSLLQMINHGLSTAALFLLVGMLYERYHTRKIADYGGMASRLPLFSVALVFMSLSSVGLPGLNGFVGEFLCFAGIGQQEWRDHHRLVLTTIAVSGMVLGAWYLFTMIRKVLFGPLREPAHDEHGEGHGGHGISDLNLRELLALAPIAILCVALGVYPHPVLRSIAPDIERVSQMAAQAEARKKGGTENAIVSPAPRNH